MGNFVISKWLFFILYIGYAWLSMLLFTALGLGVFSLIFILPIMCFSYIIILLITYVSFRKTSKVVISKGSLVALLVIQFIATLFSLVRVEDINVSGFNSGPLLISKLFPPFSIIPAYLLAVSIIFLLSYFVVFIAFLVNSLNNSRKLSQTFMQKGDFPMDK